MNEQEKIINQTWQSKVDGNYIFIELLGIMSEDELGQVQDHIYLVGTESFDVAEEAFGQHFPLETERCHHEYYCCGHWYRRKPTFTRRSSDNKIIITQESHINV